MKRVEAWHLYMIFGSVIAAAYFVPGIPLQEALYILIPASAVIALFWRAFRGGSDRTPSWYLLAAGMLAFLIGEVVWTFYETILRVPVPYPSVADIFYVGGYPLLATGMALLARTKTPWRDDAGFIDAAILACGAGLLSWVFLISPQISGSEAPVFGTVVTLLYPLGDLLLLWVTLRLLLRGGSRVPAFQMLTAGFLVMMLTDCIYTFVSLYGAYESGSPLEVGWMISFILIGAAPLHPSAAAISAEPSPERQDISRLRFGLLILASLTAPMALLIEYLQGKDISVPVIFVGSVGIFALVLSRMATLASELHRQRGEKRFRSLVQNASDAIFVLDPTGRIEYASPSVESLTGLSPASTPGSIILDIIHPDDHLLVNRLLLACLTEPTPRTQIRAPSEDGALHHLEASASDLTGDLNVGGILFTIRDVTERVALEEQLRHRAVHDALTGLPNRELFMDRLGMALERTKLNSLGTAVLFLDLDNFKMVNDSLGHEAGDELLIEVADRLSACLRPTDTVARLGGDEFTILLEDLSSDAEEARATATCIMETLSRPISVRNQEILVGASVGITLNTEDSELTPEEMLRDADTAMYEAKAHGKGCYEVFGAGMNERVIQRLQTESEMHRAMRQGEFRVYYQPSIYLKDGTVTGFEALIRWEHPERGLVSPAEFIPIAEESGLIVQIGDWVLREACRQICEWQALRFDGPLLSVSVNLSARQFRHSTLVQSVEAALEETGLDAANLILEITESVAMNDALSSRGTLQQLRDLGVSLAIDDFGTGYSSLAYLQNFPVQILKIDRSFIDQMLKDSRSASIVTTVISFARSLDLDVVAEGIETREQLDKLMELGCPVGQGFHFSRPLPEEEARRLVVSEIAH